jgi:U3 small nucleolar RNA-associated protein 19
MPKTILPKFENPLYLANFLQSCLDDPNSKLDLQVYALKGLFLLLQNHGLDYPKYYQKLYALLLPQKVMIKPKESRHK